MLRTFLVAAESSALGHIFFYHILVFKVLWLRRGIQGLLVILVIAQKLGSVHNRLDPVKSFQQFANLVIVIHRTLLQLFYLS